MQLKSSQYVIIIFILSGANFFCILAFLIKIQEMNLVKTFFKKNLALFSHANHTDATYE
jgi:hypothetical protein